MLRLPQGAEHDPAMIDANAIIAEHVKELVKAEVRRAFDAGANYGRSHPKIDYDGWFAEQTAAGLNHYWMEVEDA
jgi:hypothetical protein